MRKLRLVSIIMIISLILTNCKKKNMPENTNENSPVINTSKMLEGKFQSDRTTKDIIEIVFVEKLNKDSTKYTLKGIYKALSYYLKTNNTLEDKDYTIKSSELLIHAVNDDGKIELFGDSNGNLTITSNQCVIPRIGFKKI